MKFAIALIATLSMLATSTLAYEPDHHKNDNDDLVGALIIGAIAGAVVVEATKKHEHHEREEHKYSREYHYDNYDQDDRVVVYHDVYRQQPVCWYEIWQDSLRREHYEKICR
jgi:hypothetical protein